MLTDIRIYAAASPDPERPTKRKASSPISADEGELPPYQPSHMVDHILLDEEPIIKPAAKKRKVITSDDESLADDEPVAIPSKVRRKETRKSSKAQAKLRGKSASHALENSRKVLAVEPAEDGTRNDVLSDEEELAAASAT